MSAFCRSGFIGIRTFAIACLLAHRLGDVKLVGTGVVPIASNQKFVSSVSSSAFA
jgi:hypothetical protein